MQGNARQNGRQGRGGTIKKGNQKHREEPVYPHARTIAEEGEKQVDDDYKSTRTTTELSPTPYFGYSLVALADTHLHAIIKEPISSFVCCHHRLCIDWVCSTRCHALYTFISQPGRDRKKKPHFQAVSSSSHRRVDEKEKRQYPNRWSHLQISRIWMSKSQRSSVSNREKTKNQPVIAIVSSLIQNSLLDFLRFQQVR